MTDCIAGIDFGKTNVRFAIAADARELAYFSKRPYTRGSHEDMIRQMRDGIDAALREAGYAESNLRGIGISVPAVVNRNTGVIVWGPDWDFLGGLSNGRLGPIPNVVILFALVLLVFDHVLRRTAYGRHLMAIGNSSRNAERVGIKVNRDIVVAYIICGALGALGGILSAGQIGSVSAGFGEGNEFIVISAAVLGGTSLFGGKGSILPGAIIGIILITTIMNGLAMVNASPFIYTIVRGCIIFIAIAIDSIGHKGELR